MSHTVVGIYFCLSNPRVSTINIFRTQSPGNTILQNVLQTFESFWVLTINVSLSTDKVLIECNIKPYTFSMHKFAWTSLCLCFSTVLSLKEFTKNQNSAYTQQYKMYQNNPYNIYNILCTPKYHNVLQKMCSTIFILPFLQLCYVIFSAETRHEYLKKAILYLTSLSWLFRPTAVATVLHTFSPPPLSYGRNYNHCSPHFKKDNTPYQ